MRVTVIRTTTGVLILLGACAPLEKTNSTYSRTEIGQEATVTPGEVLAVRPVLIRGTRSAIGPAAGAAAGAAAGSAVGDTDRSRILGGIGGGVLGTLVGTTAEEALTRGEAAEFIIRQVDGRVLAVAPTNEEGLGEGDRVLILRADIVRVIRDRTGVYGPGGAPRPR
jgi:outer membrane lipoprotein SlyB